MSTPPLEVLVYGLGAIGSFYAFILSRSERVRLTVVARSNYDAVKADGIHIDSQNHGKHHVVPYRVVRNAADAGVKFDFILCAHKAIDQAASTLDIEPAVDQSRTTIVLAQNGVGNEEPFRNAFPGATILSCVVWVGARQVQPGIVTHTKAEDTQVGLYPNKTVDPAVESERLDRFVSLLAAGKTGYEVVSNVQVQRWEKVVWNVAWNSLTTLTLLDTHAWLSSSEDAVPLTRTLMKEVIDVARALDVPLEYELIDKLLKRIMSIATTTTSMRTDYENGRPMEVDIILGYPVKKGRELGIDVKTLETIYVLLTAVNKRITTSAS